MNTHPILVTGAGGFIGGQLVNELLAQGHRVRAGRTQGGEGTQQ
jgi:uncharacterized protein YbjT (DUF2867 family)